MLLQSVFLLVLVHLGRCPRLLKQWAFSLQTERLFWRYITRTIARIVPTQWFGNYLSVGTKCTSGKNQINLFFLLSVCITLATPKIGCGSEYKIKNLHFFFYLLSPCTTFALRKIRCVSAKKISKLLFFAFDFHYLCREFCR